MYALLTLFLVLALALLLARVATQALVHTGMCEETARFQAWSCLSGVGFTTKEAESIVNHPVRRQLAMMLMMVGNVGVVTVVSSLILAFINNAEHSISALTKASVLVAGIGILWLLSSSRYVDRWLKRAIDWALDRYTKLSVRDFESLLTLSGGYRVSELYIDEDDWLAGKSLRDSCLRKEGLNVLGIRRVDGSFEGEMSPEIPIRKGDSIFVYGRLASIEAIDQRRRGWDGDREHRQAIEEQQRALEEQRRTAEKAQSTQATAP